MFPVDVFIWEAIPGALMSTQTFACLNPDKFMIILLPLSIKQKLINDISPAVWTTDGASDGQRKSDWH